MFSPEKGPAMAPSPLIWFAIPTLLMMGGCQKYRAEPLEPAEIFRALADQRQPANPSSPEQVDPDAAAPATEVFTIERAAGYLRTSGPDIQEALAEYRTALALAKINTPLPNPGLEIGPQFGFGPDLGPVNEITPFGSIGFTIPLGKRLRRQTELNRALADVARVNALARFREAYLELRARYAELVISRQRLDARRALAESAERTLAAGRQLVQAGQATSLDLALFELEQQRSLVEVNAAEREVVQAEGALSRLLGMHFNCFRIVPEPSLPTLPEALPPFDDLRERLIRNHTGLGRLRAQYEATERALRLEISKQFPDLQIGPGWDNEVGERKTVIGLTLGIELPLFDRNQQGIADAKKRREEVRVQYEAEARRALAGLERAYRELDLARRNAGLLHGKILPLARTNVDLARKSLEAGAADAMRLLDTERSAREVQVEALTAELEACSAWIVLEDAVGMPLLAFPGEQNAGAVPPAELTDTSDVKASQAQQIGEDTP